jgi:hypothetical protein
MYIITDDPLPYIISLAVAQKLSKTNLFPDPLPEPWQEHYDERYKRCYYYNPQSGQSSWERPKAPPTTTTSPSSLTAPTTPSKQKGSKSPRLPSRTDSMQGRPLPAAPGIGSSTGGDSMSSKSSQRIFKLLIKFPSYS